MNVFFIVPFYFLIVVYVMCCKENGHFENFYKCFNPFCMGKKYWISDFQFFGWIIKIYWKFLQVSFSLQCEENGVISKIFKNGFFQRSSKFFGKCSESSDSSRKLKISKSIFSHTKWVKTLVKIFKNRIFQKCSKLNLQKYSQIPLIHSKNQISQIKNIVLYKMG